MAEATEIDEHDDDNGWQELMGKDLMMKVVDSIPRKLLDRVDKTDNIEPQEAVLVGFEGRTAENRSVKDGLLFQKVSSWLVVVGDADVLPALEMGIRYMRVGQTALIWSHSKFALGNGTRITISEDSSANECGLVPPNSNVMYKVTVTQKVMDTSRLNPYFTIQKALTKKKIANDIYQNEWCKPPETSESADCEHAMKRALRLYTKAAKEMETLVQGTYFNFVEEDHPQRHESRQILLDSLNNIVAVHLRQKKYHAAKLSAVEVLRIDPNNIKVLLRAAKAAMMDPASTLEEASAAINAAESAIVSSSKKKKSPNEKELKRLKNQLKEKRDDYKEKTKAMFGDKLNSMTFDSKGDAKSTETRTSKSGKNEKEEHKIVPNSHTQRIMSQFFIPLIILFLMKYIFVNGNWAAENSKSEL